jgi:asparagine N-glycosylation enzyme membrane subunit Stt3
MYSAAMRMLLADPFRAIWFNALNSLNGLRPGASYLIMYLELGKINPDSVTNGELSPAISNIGQPEILLVTVVLSVFYGLLYLLSAIGILQLLWERKWMALALLVVPCILIMYIPALASNARFRIPIEPILCLLAALALCKAIPSFLEYFSKRTPLSQ